MSKIAYFIKLNLIEYYQPDSILFFNSIEIRNARQNITTGILRINSD